MADNEAWVLDGLALNDGTALTLEAVDLTPPPELEEWIKGADSNGALLAREPLCDNRVVTMTLRVERTATMDLALAKIGLVVDKLKECQRNANGLALTYLPHDSALTALTVRCLSGQIVGLPVDITSGWLVNTPQIMLKLTCLPFFEGAEVTSYVNEITNPRASVNTTGMANTSPTGFLASGATITRDTGQSPPIGTTTFKVVTGAVNQHGGSLSLNAVIPAGRTYAISFYAKGAAGGEVLEWFLDLVPAFSTVQAATLTTGWVRYTTLFTTTVTSGASPSFVVRQNTATAKTWYMTLFQVAAVASTASVPTYFDGDTGTGYVWLGTTGLSASAGPNAVLSTEPIVPLELSSIAGDVTAKGRIIVTDNAAQSRRFVPWGLESRWYPTSSAPSLTIDSTSMVTSGYTGATNTLSGAYSGGSNNVILAGIRPQVQAACALGSLTHVGQFRPQLRASIAPADLLSTVHVRLAYQVGDGPWRNLPWQAPAVTGWNNIDLGLVTIPAAVRGAQRWTGRIETYDSGVTIGGSINVDAVWLMPAEQFGRARATYAYQPGPAVGADTFPSITAGTALNGRTATTGGTWATSGATTDFAAADAPLATDETEVRSTTSDSGVGRHAVLGSTAYADTEVSVDFYRTVSPGTSSTFRQGVQARWVDASNRFEVTVSGDFTFLARKVVAGATTTLASFYYPAFQLSAWYNARVVIFASGRFFATLTGPDGGTIAVLTGQDAVLATGGALDDGKPAFIDYNGTATASTRYYENFYAATPPAEPIVCYSGQSIEFREDTTLREDSTGVYYGPPTEYVGGRPFFPPAGGPARKTRIAVMARRNDVMGSPDDNIADSLLVQASWVPRYLVVPYE